MLKPLRLGMVPHSKLSHLTTLLPGGTLVCSLMILSAAGLHGLDLDTNDGVCDRIRGFDPCQIELFMGMMEMT